MAAKWFRPETTTKSAAILAQARPDLLHESPSERAERMVYGEADRREDRLRALDREVYGNIPFRPAIDPLSRALGRESDLTELSENQRGKQIRDLLRRKVEARMNEECSFRPKINELSRQLVQPGLLDEDQEFLRRYDSEFRTRGWAEESAFEAMERLQEDAEVPRPPTTRINMQEPEKMARDIRLCLLEKEERRRAELVVREIEELRECTFHPRVPTYVPENPAVAAPIVIKGLGRHLELKHLSARQKQEAAQREKEVFSVQNVDKFRRAEDGSTIVQVSGLCVL